MGVPKYAKMFEPIKIGNIQLKNRLVMAPATTNYSQAGYPTDQQKRGGGLRDCGPSYAGVRV
jgi:hypothetical protein